VVVLGGGGGDTRKSLKLVSEMSPECRKNKKTGGKSGGRWDTEKKKEGEEKKGGVEEKVAKSDRKLDE